MGKPSTYATPTIMKDNSSFFQSLLKENKPYFLITLGLVIVTDGIVYIVQYVEGLPLELGLYNSLISLSMIVIPLIAVNLIFLLKYNYLERCKTPAEVFGLKSLGLYVGVVLGTILFEMIYAYFGFEDNDYIVLGSFEFSASTSEVITNIFNATIFGLPIFYRQGVQDKAKKELQRKSEELKSANELHTKSQLEALQARVNPHFLYNSLNSIASLIHINPDQAEKMVLSLSELFRYSLNYSDGQLSTIAHEVKMVETYLGIELIRFGDQLECEIEVDPSIENVMIPRFLLQPIVENAIKHGTSKVSHGKIRVSIKPDQNNIIMEVEDNGPAFPDDFNIGYGTKCITDQLELLYRDQHFFGMLNTPVKHVKIILENALSHEYTPENTHH